MKNKKGFTIIELMVVIAIIGILSAVALASFTELKQRSNDVKRMSDMREISKALSLYSTDHGKYPISTGKINIDGTDGLSAVLKSEGFINQVPRDFTPGMFYTYQTNSEGSTFTLTFCLQTNSIPNYTQGCGNSYKP